MADFKFKALKPEGSVYDRLAKEQELLDKSGQNVDLVQDLDPGIETTMDPVDFVGPGELKALGNAAILAPGIINKRAMLTRVGSGLGLKEGQTIKDALAQILKKQPGADELSGAGLMDSSGKSAQEFIKSLRNKAEEYGTEIVSDPSVLKGSLKKRTEKSLGKEGAAAIFLPDKNIIINNPAISKQANVYSNTGTLAHELEHAGDLVKNQFPEDIQNYVDFDKLKAKQIKRVVPDVGNVPKMSNDLYFNMLDKVSELANKGEVDKAEKLLNALKQRHFAEYKNFELENTLNPLVKSMDEITPEEIELLKKYPSLRQYLPKK